MAKKRDIIFVAVSSRIILVCLQYIGNILISDHEAHVFMYLKDVNHTALDKTVQHFLNGFLRWDAHYFLHIAKYGYTYENTLAFFPLFPFIVRVISSVITFIIPLLNLDTSILLVSILLNMYLFIEATKVLFKITTIMFDEAVAYKSCILFCYNPASIFFIAPYTECLFCYLTLKSILNCLILFNLYSHRNFKIVDIFYLLPVSLSTLARSNGVLNIGFLVYTELCLYLKFYPLKSKITSKMLYSIKHIFFMMNCVIICLTPFLVYQIYCYHMFCTNFKSKLPSFLETYAVKNNFILPGQFYNYNQSWCYNRIPLAYSYVQNHYWNVGFLNYYELKQIPNFLLAAPMLYILIKNCFVHIWHNLNTNLISLFSFDSLNKSCHSMFSPKLNVFVVHALFLSVFCILFVHIQISTRMLCSSTPFVYWCVANYFKDNEFDDGFWSSLCKKKCYVKYYFAMYYIVGTILFCNFLPWT